MYCAGGRAPEPGVTAVFLVGAAVVGAGSVAAVLGAVYFALLGSGAHAGGLHFLAWLGALGLLVLVTLIQALRRPSPGSG
jgi:hypothetical protein